MRHGEASRAAELRRFVADTLSAASREILAAVDVLVAELEEEAAGFRRQVARQLEVRPSGAKCSRPVDTAEDRNPENRENHENLHLTSPSRSSPRRCVGPGSRKNHILLRLRILDGPRTAVLPRSELRSPVQELRCRPGLQEADFALLLRTRFPQLAGGGAFDLLTSDRRRRLRPLQPERLTPEEIRRSAGSSRRRSCTVHIRLREQEQQEPAGVQIRPISSPASEEPGRPTSPPAAALEGPRAAGAAGNSSGTEIEPSDGEAQETPEPENDGGKRKPERTEGKLTRRKQGPAGSPGSPGPAGSPGPSGSLGPAGSPGPGPAPAGVCGIKLEHADVTCKVCRSAHGSEAELAEHVSHRHAGEPENVCEEVSDSTEHLQNPHRPFPAPPDVAAGEDGQRGGGGGGEAAAAGRHRCSVCRQEFPLREQLKTHRRAHGASKSHLCGVCGKSLSDYRSLSRHMTVHSEERPHACALCGKRFKLVGTLRQHEKIHTERQRSFLCDVCCKMFLTAQQLRDHMMTHGGGGGGGRRHRCAQCGRGFIKKGALTAHQRVHSGEAPYRCPHCGWAFRWKSNLAEHLRVHSGAKPYVCAVCGKACARKVYLTVHMRTHSGERPYRCAVCHKVFTQSHCLKTHMRRHQAAAAAAAPRVSPD